MHNVLYIYVTHCTRLTHLRTLSLSLTGILASYSRYIPLPSRVIIVDLFCSRGKKKYLKPYRAHSLQDATVGATLARHVIELQSKVRAV